MTRRELAEWLVDTCVLFGASAQTAFKVAGIFIADPAITDAALAEFGPVPEPGALVPSRIAELESELAKQRAVVEAAKVVARQTRTARAGSAISRLINALTTYQGEG